jgi:hypothetical protein
MSKSKFSESSEITLDQELRASLKKCVKELEVCRDLCGALCENKGREKSPTFYRALGGNIQCAYDYVRFSSTDYLREGD